MTPEMAFESLLVSGDSSLACITKEALHKFSIEVDECADAARACEKINARSHELVVMDWECDPSCQLLHTIWRSPAGRKPTILAISPGGTHVTGAHFTIGKPFEPDSITESLKSVYSRMLVDYRRTARYPVMAKVMAQDDKGRTFPVNVTDIGEGGLGIACKQELEVGSAILLTLPLPQTLAPIHIQARVLWTRDYGAAGCCFLSMPPVDRDVLRRWLETKVQIKKPLVSVS